LRTCKNGLRSFVVFLPQQQDHIYSQVSKPLSHYLFILSASNEVKFLSTIVATAATHFSARHAGKHDAHHATKVFDGNPLFTDITHILQRLCVSHRPSICSAF
jgi:hypothetical protein